MAETATFQLKLKDLFSSKAKRASRALGGFNQKLSSTNKSMGGFFSAQKNAAAAASMGANAASQMGRSLAGTAIKAFAAVKAVEMLSRGVMAFGGAVADTAAFDDRMTLAFERLTHDGEGTFRHVKRLAEVFGLEVNDTAKAYKNFLALQFKPAMADKLVAMGADLQALGADAEEVKGIFTALGQIKSKGKVQAEEMLQLAERGVSQELIYAELGKNLGKSKDEIMSMQQAGKVTADDFFVAFEGAINKKLGQSSVGESGKQFANTTLAGMTGKIKAKATNIWKELVKGATPMMVEALGGLSKKFDEFALSPAGQKTFGMVGAAISGLAKTFAFVVPLAIDFFGAMVEGSSETFGALSSVFGQDGNGASLGGLKAMLPELGRLFGNVMGVAVFLIGEVGKTAIMLTGIIGGMAQGIRDFGGWFVSTIGNALLAFDDFKAKLGSINLWDTALGLGKDIVMGMSQGILNFMTSPIDAVLRMGTGIISTAKRVLGIKSPSKEFERLGMFSGEGFAMGLNSSMAPANDVMPEFMTDSARAARRNNDFSGVTTGARGVTLNLKVTVNGVGGSPDEVGEAVATKIESKIEDFFLGLSDESAA